MYLKWIGPLALLAALVIGDQIRINRPGHKYRMTVEVETPEGIRSGSSILAVTPYRGYNPGGTTRTSGDAPCNSNLLRGKPPSDGADDSGDAVSIDELHRVQAGCLGQAGEIRSVDPLGVDHDEAPDTEPGEKLHEEHADTARPHDRNPGLGQDRLADRAEQERLAVVPRCNGRVCL